MNTRSIMVALSTIYDRDPSLPEEPRHKMAFLQKSRHRMTSLFRHFFHENINTSPSGIITPIYRIIYGQIINDFLVVCGYTLY